LGIPLTPKAALVPRERPYPPGEHRRNKRKTDSDYAVSARSSACAPSTAIREAQLKIQFEEARSVPLGLTGENLVEQLEMRLDALIVRAAIARTTAQQARQMIVHRHYPRRRTQRVDRPSFPAEAGTAHHPRTPRAEGMEPFQVAAGRRSRGRAPKILLPISRSRSTMLQARLVRRPKRAEVPVTREVQLVVEYHAAR
jgi:small subunit ribosomal protein S4